MWRVIERWRPHWEQLYSPDANFDLRGRADIRAAAGWRCPCGRCLNRCQYGLTAVVGAVTVHRECVGVCGDGAHPDDGQTDQCGDDDVVHISSPKVSSIDISLMRFWVDWPPANPVLPGPVMATCRCERKYQLSLELIERRYRSAGIIPQRRTTTPVARGSAHIRITPRADVGLNAIQGGAATFSAQRGGSIDVV